MYLKDIETPALIVDVNIFNANRDAMDEILKGSDLKLRPHYKSHKTAQIARMQINNGAKGMTCAKVSEALDLADAGIEDILIANQITDLKKINTVAHLAKACHLTVCVDDIKNVKDLAKACENANSTLYCLVEYEIGMQRCGVTDWDDVLTLAREIKSHSNLKFDGIQAYAGHISHMVDIEERKALTETNFARIRGLVAYLKENGINVNIVSGGSTGTCQIKAKGSPYNELQAGSYLFMDATYKDLNLPFKNSLFVLSSVVSKRDGLTVVDAGVKTCGVDQGMPEILYNKAEEIVASEEHFQLHNLEKPLEIGDKVLLVPGHCCSTINLHDRIYLVDNGKVIDRLMITARGMGK